MTGPPAATLKLRWVALDGWANERDITPGSLTIGRSSTCDVVIPHSRVSRRHARLEMRPDGRMTIRDLGSRNCVFVNGTRTAEADLHAGDAFALGPIGFTVEAETGASRADATATAVPRPPMTPSLAQPGMAEAEQAYRQAIAAGNTRAHNNLGLLLQAQGDFAGAEAEYRQALDAGHGAAGYNLSSMLLERGDSGGSQRMLEKGRAAGPSAPSASLPLPPVSQPAVRPGPEQLAAIAPRKHRARTWAVASGAAVAGIVMLFAVAHALTPPAPCKRNCPIPPPPRVPALADPTRYHSSRFGFSLAYDGALKPLRVTDSFIGWALQNGQGHFSPSIFGVPASGRTADQIVADSVRAYFPQFSFQYRIPAAEIGYTPGAGAVYAGTWMPLQGQSLSARLAVVAAVRKGVGIVLECEGSQISESGAVHPDPSGLAGDSWCDQTINTVVW